MKARHITMSLSRLRIRRGRQMGEQRRMISLLITIRQSWPLVSFSSSLAIQVKMDTVRGFLTFLRLLCYCTKHMARPNMPKLKPFCQKQMRMTLNGIEHLTNMACQEWTFHWTCELSSSIMILRACGSHLLPISMKIQQLELLIPLNQWKLALYWFSRPMRYLSPWPLDKWECKVTCPARKYRWPRQSYSNVSEPWYTSK